MIRLGVIGKPSILGLSLSCTSIGKFLARAANGMVTIASHIIKKSNTHPEKARTIVQSLLHTISKQRTYPCRQSRDHREDDQKLYQLTLYVVSVPSASGHTLNFRKIELEKVKLHKQEIIEECHVVYLIDRKDKDESEKELPKCKSASKSVPN